MNEPRIVEAHGEMVIPLNRNALTEKAPQPAIQRVEITRRDAEGNVLGVIVREFHGND